MSTRSTQVSQLIRTSPDAVYQAFLQPEAITQWLPPEQMTGSVEIFEPYEGGSFRITLTYRDAADSGSGKTSDNSDTVTGTFSVLRPNQEIVWITSFDSDDPAFAGDMRITWSLAAVRTGTAVTVRFENIPPGIRLEDNETGSRQTLHKLAAYVEQRSY
jgi:uncharacterized protein YndB with AHSA1/START domain